MQQTGTTTPVEYNFNFVGTSRSLFLSLSDFLNMKTLLLNRIDSPISKDFIKVLPFDKQQIEWLPVENTTSLKT